MGVRGKFWELLKPCSRTEGFDFLRNKRVAVDLSFWIVQHETAIKGNARNPHIRLAFFRTVNLFSKVSALKSISFFVCSSFGLSVLSVWFPRKKKMEGKRFVFSLLLTHLAHFGFLCSLEKIRMCVSNFRLY